MMSMSLIFQRWYDEGERQKKLMEKHSRGNVARVNREARIQEKEKRKLIRENRYANDHQIILTKQFGAVRHL